MKALTVCLLYCLFACSCSLSYISETPSDVPVPELILEKSALYRVSDNHVSSVLKAQYMEQYKEDNSFYGTGITLYSYDKDGTIEIEGTATAMSGSEKAQVYSLFDGASFYRFSDNTKISGKDFRWNADLETLVAGKNDEVHVFQGKNKLSMSGRGFSANGITMDFQFTDSVLGSMNTQEE